MRLTDLTKGFGWSPWGFFGLLVISLLAAYPYFEQTRNANERPRLLQSMALVDTGEWVIDGPARRNFDTGPDISRSPNGHIYPNKPPGASVVGAAAYATGRFVHEMGGGDFTLREFTWWARLFGGILPTLLIAGIAWNRWLPEQGPEPMMVGLGLYVLGSPVASYAHLFYGHQIAALLLFFGVGLLADAKRHTEPRRAFAGGVLAGAAVAVEYGAVFAALPIGVMLLSCARKPDGLRTIGAAVGGALVPIALLAWYHHAAFGSPFETGYHHVIDPGFKAKHSQGFLGLGMPTWEGFQTHILSMDGGLMWWAPLFPVALYGLIQLSIQHEHHRRTEARLHLALFVLYIIIGSGLSFDGGWRVGPRYLIVVMPSLILGWVFVFNEIKDSPIGMGVFVLFATWSLVVNALAANFWPHLDLTYIDSPIAEVLVPLLQEGYRPYDVVGWMGIGWGHYIYLGLPVLGMIWVFFQGSELGSRMVIMLTAGACGGLLAVKIAAVSGGDTHPKSPANLRYIQLMYEPPKHRQDPEEWPKSIPIKRLGPTEVHESTRDGGRMKVHRSKD